MKNKKKKKGMNYTSMKCPYCGVENTRVIDSRPADDGASIRRRRQCDACDKRFTTYEKVETIPLVVVKKDLTRELYDRSKIEKGVYKSCHKLPVSSEKVPLCVNQGEYTFTLQFELHSFEMPLRMVFSSL